MKQKNILKKFICVIPAALVLIGVLYLIQRSSAAAVMESTSAPSEETDYSIHFSVPSGFYEDDFSLTLSGPEGFSIYYTLDGSTPDADSNLYSEPLTVTNVSHQEKVYSIRSDLNTQGYSVGGDSDDKAYIIRAVGIDSSGVSTEITSATYFVGYEDNCYEDYAVVSLVTDPDNLFDSTTGIYVLGDSYQEHVANGGDPSYYLIANYFQTGRKWERDVHLDYFDTDKNYLFSQECGIRINGNSSREDSQKSFRLYARKEYDGNSLFTYSFFEDKQYLNSIILRRGLFENQFLPSLVTDRDIAIQDYIPCIVFVDGEYWGKYYLIERYDTDYIEAHYNVDADNVTIIKDGALFDGSETIYNNYNELLYYMSSHDLSVAENYEYVCGQLDIQSYIDYYCTQIYINNYDFSESKNTVLWRANDADSANPYADGKWRFALMDVDLSLIPYGQPDAYKLNSFANLTAVVIHTEETMFKALLANESFRQQFVTSFLDMENENFRYENIAPLLEQYEDLLSSPDSIHTFFQNRPDYINEHLATIFLLDGTLAEVSLEINDASAGSVQLNTITPDLTAGTWSGNYYTDYPVTLTALPNDGYQFKCWIVDGVTYTDTELTIPVSEFGTQIQAIYEQEN